MRIGKKAEKKSMTLQHKEEKCNKMKQNKQTIKINRRNEPKRIRKDRHISNPGNVEKEEFGYDAECGIPSLFGNSTFFYVSL